MRPMVASRSTHKPAPVSKRTRFEVLRRDGNRCRYCGATAEESPLTIDHVIPVALGGSNKPDNLVAACKDCNAGKTSTHPDGQLVAEVADDAIRWARAMQVAADERQATREQQHEAGARFLAVWDRWTYPDGSTTYLPTGWAAQIDRWMTAGLTMDDLCELADYTLSMSKVTEKWRYFAGCCWGRLTEMNARALELVNQRAEPHTCDVTDLGDPCESVRTCELADIRIGAYEQGYDKGWENRNYMSAADLADNHLQLVVDRSGQMKKHRVVIFDGYPGCPSIPVTIAANPWAAA